MNCGKKKPNISYFHLFGVKCFILNNKENLRKFDSNSDEGILLGYRAYNSRTSLVEESIHVRFNDFKPNEALSE